jgi:SHS2 domain-containing protein
MEVKGKTLKELIQNLLKHLNAQVTCEGNYTLFSTKFEVKGKSMEEILKNFGKKIINYYHKKNVIFEEVKTEIIPAKKWILRCVLNGKTFERLVANFKEIKELKLEEKKEGWKLLFSVE